MAREVCEARTLSGGGWWRCTMDKGHTSTGHWWVREDEDTAQLSIDDALRGEL